MNTEHLKYFCDAVALESITASAKKNHVSNGAVSQAIIKLEEVLNTKLLFHKKNLFDVTEEGKEFYQRAIEIVDKVDHLFLDFLDKESNIKGDMLFSTQQSLAEYFLISLVKNFKKSYPEINPIMTLGNTSITKKRLENKLDDFSIMLNNVELKDFSSKVIHKGEFVLYSGKSSLHDESFLLTEDTLEVISFFKSYRQKYKIEPSIQMRVNSWGTLKKMADVGMGIALIPDYMVSKSEMKKVLQFGIKLPHYEIVMAWPKNRDLSKKGQAFLELF